jgi:hypothetical protein
VLGSLRWRLRGLLLIHAVLAIVAVLLGAALAGVFADAILILSQPLRIVAPWIIAACAMVLLVALVARLLRITPTRLARSLEAADPALGTKLTNAVQLSAVQPA